MIGCRRTQTDRSTSNKSPQLYQCPVSWTMRGVNWFILFFCWFRSLLSQPNRNSSKSLHCTIDNIYHGSWEYGEQVQIHDLYSQCPLTLQKIRTTYLGHQTRDYNCANKTYRHAEYIPPPISSTNNNSCLIRSIRSSLKLLDQHRVKISFLGDSLMGQLYIAFLCASEANGYFHQSSLSSEYLMDFFLRPGLACNKKCLEDDEYLANETQKIFIHECFNCRDRIYHELNETFPHNPQFWPYRLREGGATHVIVGAGSWYGGYHKIFSAQKEYRYMLEVIKPILENHTISSRPRSVHWLDLPAMIVPKEDTYGWVNFLPFNSIAREFFQNSSIHYLDTSRATESRKMRDENVTDRWGHHWCNPGSNMIPTFQIKTYLHLITEQLV